jgi:hypothetical protein
MRFTSSPARHVYGSISYVSIRIKSELWPATISSGTLSLHSVYIYGIVIGFVVYAIKSKMGNLLAPNVGLLLTLERLRGHQGVYVYVYVIYSAV